MMSCYFRLRSELSGAIAKILQHAKNQLYVHGSFFNQFVTYTNQLEVFEILLFSIIISYKRASLAWTARLADTLYPPERPKGAWAHID